jgi:hypothetical protein
MGTLQKSSQGFNVSENCYNGDCELQHFSDTLTVVWILRVARDARCWRSADRNLDPGRQPVCAVRHIASRNLL